MSGPVIHPTAVIDSSAELGNNISVGAYSVIGPDVIIGDDCKIASHVVLSGPLRMGKENQVFQFASIGEAPQDKKYNGEKTGLIIGDRNTFREYVTVNRGTVQDRGATEIGSDNWIMAYCHVAHDCVIGNDCIMSNAASLAGHVFVDDHAILGGFSLIHQFCHIGSHAFTAFGSVVNQDVPPYVTVSGHLAEPRGVNTEGLKRHGFQPEVIREIKNAYKLIYMAGLRLEDAIARISEKGLDCDPLQTLVEFLKNSKRGIIR